MVYRFSKSIMHKANPVTLFVYIKIILCFRLGLQNKLIKAFTFGARRGNEEKVSPRVAWTTDFPPLPHLPQTLSI